MKPPRGALAEGTGDVCLAVVTNDLFLSGALVAIGSFLRQHPGFAGDIVVIHDGLSETSREVLAALSERLTPRAAGTELRERIARLDESFTLQHRAQLLSLEAFRLTGYRKVLLCDADILFLQPVSDLFDLDSELVGCGDGASVRGLRRVSATFVETDDPGALDRTFNSGFLVIDARLLGEHPYAELLELVTPATWRNVVTGHVDQVVMNRCLSGRATLISWTNNYLLRYARAIRAREGLSWRDARVLHFNLPFKPWMPNAVLRTAVLAESIRTPVMAPVPEMLSAFRLWQDAWLECVANVHLRSVVRHRERPSPNGHRVNPTTPSGPPNPGGRRPGR